MQNNSVATWSNHQPGTCLHPHSRRGASRESCGCSEAFSLHGQDRTSSRSAVGFASLTQPSRTLFLAPILPLFPPLPPARRGLLPWMANPNLLKRSFPSQPVPGASSWGARSAWHEAASAPELPGRGPMPVAASCAAGAGGAQRTPLASTPRYCTRSLALASAAFAFQPLGAAVERSNATSNRGCDPGHLPPVPSHLCFSPRTLSPREGDRVHRHRAMQSPQSVNHGASHMAEQPRHKYTRVPSRAELKSMRFEGAQQSLLKDQVLEAESIISSSPSLLLFPP